MFRQSASARSRLLPVFLGLAALIVLVSCGGGGQEVALTVLPGGVVQHAITFVGMEAGSLPAVYVVSIEGGKPLRIAQDEDKNHYWPSWSPDGRQLAFIAWLAPQQLTATPQAGETATPAATETATAAPEDMRARWLMVANTDGTGERTLADTLLLNSGTPTFRWSPDGTRIIYMTVADVNEEPLQSLLRVVDVTSGQEIPLTEERLGFLPAWSPDGTRIVFGAYTDELDSSGQQETELFVMDSDGSNLRQLASRPGPDLAPVWSSDGKRIAWWGAEPGGQGNSVFIVDVETGEMTALGEGANPVWSPDGRHIAFVQEQKPPPGLLRTRPDIDILTIDVETGERINVTSNPAHDLWPTWSPDGRQIAFVSDRDNSLGEIYLVNADGSDVRRLTENKIAELMLTWSPQ
jgi:Tol biopolymer transport system component